MAWLIFRSGCAAAVHTAILAYHFHQKDNFRRVAEVMQDAATTPVNVNRIFLGPIKQETSLPVLSTHVLAQASNFF